MEGSLTAASSEAGVALGAAIDAHSTAAGGLMHLVDGFSVGIVDLEARDAAVALLLDLDRTMVVQRSEVRTSGRNIYKREKIDLRRNR